ncbi:hypothetical protein SAMN04487819_1282 [Actinopolyspora alba]|uniref:Uncharacterized protein n=1 Tax=Actinopolyspora alba TaxID=673379 RepID=A0A1I2CMH6_9ACTN|nr:hypothetical protein [Actinopolyspora alba]SFE69516.1 hypothetical protein SAMN04487819_1282 [Actinopolyspora alba]
MPQFRKEGVRKDPAVREAAMRDAVRNGVDVGTDYASVRAQLHRLGKDGVRAAAQAAGHTPPSDRTIRRWAQQNRIPHERVAEAAQRADRVTRLGGVEAAAQQAGRSPKTVRDWMSNLDRQMRGDAQSAMDSADTADRRSAAGIPVTSSGTPARGAVLFASGDVNVKGSSSSSAYERYRNVLGHSLDVGTTQRIVEAMEAGDEDAARTAAEEFLSTGYAECEGYGPDFGWHFESLDNFQLIW